MTTKTNKTKITLWGGFHNVGSINILVNTSDIEDLKEGNVSLADIVTPYQAARLDKHFCGMADCCCKGFRNAEWEIAK